MWFHIVLRGILKLFKMTLYRSNFSSYMCKPKEYTFD